MPKKRTAAMVEGPPSKKPTRSPVKPAPQEKGSSNTQIYLHYHVELSVRFS